MAAKKTIESAKRNLITSLLNILFEPEERRLDLVVTELDKQNREMKGHTRQGFILGGRIFIPQKSQHNRDKGGYPSLAWPLNEQANAFLRDANSIRDDKQMISQIMGLAIMPCSTVDDIRNALPESIVVLNSDLLALPRTNVEGYTLLGNERSMQHFRVMSAKVDFYAALRMVY